MIVFVEGADGAGKTTLVEQLKPYYPTITITRSAQSTCPTVWEDLMKASQGRIFIADRCFLSDYVYRLHDLEKGEYNLADVMCYLARSAVIYCKTDSQYEDAMARGEDNITNKIDAADIRNLYDFIIRVVKKEGIPVFNYSWKEQNVQDVLNFIKKMKGENK